jgi:CheY-like chemotaxis protein
MEKIIIINNGQLTEKFIQNLGYPVTDYNSQENGEIHTTWIDFIKKNQPNCIIMPLELDNVMDKGLLIALHLRLNFELSIPQRCCSFVFTTNDTLDDLFKRTKVRNNRFLLHNLLITDGIAIRPANAGEVNIAIQNLKPLNPLDYKKTLSKLHILPTEAQGRHSLANIWGAIFMARMTQMPTKLDKLEHKLRDPYYKHIICANERSSDEGKTPLENPQISNATNKKILLIDDQADNGWADVLKHVFKNADFHFVKKIADAENVIKEDWDLILLDLRLNEQEAADETKDPSTYSGAELLKTIKERNRGTQVIVMTASNKSWNIKTILDMGADGYYVKEAPESGFSYEMSLENYTNFKKQAEGCLNRGYLKETFEKHKRYTKAVVITDANRVIINSYISNLDIAFELLYKYAETQNPKYLNYAFLTYYQILEMYANDSNNFYKEKYGCYIDKNGINFKVVERLNRVWELKYRIDKKPHYYEKMRSQGEDENFLKESLAKISFIIAFKLGKGNAELMKFAKLNDLRNKKAAHGGVHFVTIDNVIALRDLVLEILQS